MRLRYVVLPRVSRSTALKIALKAFYVPNKDRRNLNVLVTAPVRRVLTTASPSGDLIATGVEFEYEGKVYDVNARKEVIVSSGYVSTSIATRQDSDITIEPLVRLISSSSLGSEGVISLRKLVYLSSLLFRGLGRTSKSISCLV